MIEKDEAEFDDAKYRLSEQALYGGVTDDLTRKVGWPFMLELFRTLKENFERTSATSKE